MTGTGGIYCKSFLALACLSLFLAIGGCISAYNAMEHRDLVADAKLDPKFKVAGPSLRTRTVYLKVLDPNQLCTGLKPALSEKLAAGGYKLVEYPAEADYLLRVSLQGIQNQATNTIGASSDMHHKSADIMAGYANAAGGTWQGAAGAAAIIIYSWLETLGSALFPVDQYSLQATVQLWQRTQGYPVEAAAMPPWEKRQALLTVTARQTGLDHSEAGKLLSVQITDSLAKVFLETKADPSQAKPASQATADQ